MGVIFGTSGNDRLKGTRWADEIFGLAGDDVIRGLKGGDILDGGPGDDKLFGGPGNDELHGGEGDDLLKGGRGDDVLYGGTGADRLLGGKGADLLFGGDDTDLLDGRKGNDILTGGEGPDIFVFRANYGHDTIKDFELGVDTLRLDDNLWKGSLSILEVVETYAEVIDGNIVFVFDRGILTLEGFDNLEALKDALIVRDQGRIFGTDGFIDLGTDLFTQSITMGVSGGLASIQVQYELQRIDEIQPVTFSIYAGTNDDIGELLYSETVAAPELDDVGVFEWILPSDDLVFEAGDAFILAFEALEDGMYFAASDPPDYPGGELYEDGVPSTQVGDLAFITYVEVGAIEII